MYSDYLQVLTGCPNVKNIESERKKIPKDIRSEKSGNQSQQDNGLTIF